MTIETTVVDGIPLSWVRAEMRSLAGFRRMAEIPLRSVADRSGYSVAHLSRMEQDRPWDMNRTILMAYIQCLWPNLCKLSEI